MSNTEIVKSEPTIDGSGGTLAIIHRLRPHRQGPGLEFITAPSADLQVATMSYPAGHKIVPHRHPPQHRRIIGTPEVVVVMRGSVSVDLYEYDGRHRARHVLYDGDLIVLFGGGHGFEILEDGTLLYEVKQGPYQPGADKERFGGEYIERDPPPQGT